MLTKEKRELVKRLIDEEDIDEAMNILQHEIKNRVKVSLPVHAYYNILKQWGNETVEYFFVIGLNNRGGLKYVDVVSQGITDKCLVHPTIVFSKAVRNKCKSIIIAHNHPSQDCTPSPEDIDITKRLKQSGEILGIQILDHIIFCGDDYYSFVMNSMM